MLKISLGGDLPEEQLPERRLFPGLRRGDDYLAMVTLLRWARADDRLRGVFVAVDRLHCGWARVQGLWQGLQRLRAAGKCVWVHLQHPGLREYLVATAADKIWISPSDVLDVAGLSAEATFFLGTLEKLGIRADIIQIGAYKAAAEPFTRRSMSSEHRQMVEALVDDLYGQIASTVAQCRGKDPASAAELLGRGPFVAREAREVGLVDGIGYAQEVEEELARECGGDVIDCERYRRWRGRAVQRRALWGTSRSIAVVHVWGALKAGESIPGPEGSTAAGEATISRELNRLVRRDDIAAIVLRVASPGGSALASDQLWHCVRRAREEKPVVVSLGDVAASGGYYVASGGDTVLAQPGTITGSIGVIAGKAEMRGLYERLGVTKEIVSRGKHAALYSDYLPLGPGERERLEAEARSFYDGFVAKVAEARRLSREVVEAGAEGRVWTGRQAAELGLVDRFGDIEDAIEEAKLLAGIPRDQWVRIARFPRPLRFWPLPLGPRPWRRVPERVNLPAWFAIFPGERVLALLPFQLRFF